MELLGTTLTASLLLSLLLAPMGCLVVWRGMSFVGEALSHGALLGVALSTIWHLPMGVGIWGVSLLMVLLVQPLGRYLKIETMLACWMYVSLGLALWLIAGPNEDMLWGDILTLSPQDLAWMTIGTIVILGLVLRYWRVWLWYGLQSEMAQVETPNIIWHDRIFWIVVATVTALSCQSVGTLLVPALLVLPASAIRPLIRTPQGMMIGALLTSLAAFACSLPGVFYYDWPVGPSVVVILGGFTGLFHWFNHIKNKRVHA